MKRFVILLLLAILPTSCAYFQSPKTLDEEKAHLDCIKFEKGIPWAQISDKFGEPDSALLPEPSPSLARNTRVYKSKTLILYTDLQEVKEGDKIRFREAVTDIEICKKK